MPKVMEDSRTGSPGRFCLKAIAFAALAFGLGDVSFAANPQYVLTDLGTLGGKTSNAAGINASGQVTGGAALTGDTTTHAFIYTNGVMKDVGPAPDGTYSAGTGINASGQLSISDGGTAPWLYSNGTFTDLDTSSFPPAYANAINDAGHVTGITEFIGFFYNGTLNFFPGPLQNSGNGSSINNSDMITGNALTGGPMGQNQAFVLNPADGSYGWIYPFGGALNSGGNGINAVGNVTGWGDYGYDPNTLLDNPPHAFLYDPTGTHDLGTLGGSTSHGNALNDNNVVVGDSTLAGDAVTHAFIYTSGAMLDLNTLVASGPLAQYVTLTSGTGINNNGWIVANGVDSRTGNTHGYLLTPAGSLDGTSIPFARSIVDGGQNVWTVSNGQVFENGKPTQSSSVTLLLYLGGNIYQENVHKIWYRWNTSSGSWAMVADPLVASVNGTMVPTASYLVDGSLNLWALSGGQVYENGQVTQSSSVILLVYSGGSVYQENVHKAWYRWNPTTGSWVASANPGSASVSGTTVPAAAEIVDGDGKIWALSGGKAYVDGQVTPSGAVTLLLYFGGTVYQENAQNNWWLWNVNTASWQATSDPRVPSSSGTTVPSATQIVDAAHNVWAIFANQAYQNGQPTASSSVTLLLYANGLLYQENIHHNWYVWRNGAWAATAAISPPSPGFTTIPTATQIVDNQLNVWTVSNGVVYENHAATLSSSVTLLLFYGGLIYQQNVHGNWYKWTGTAWVSTPGDPRN